VSDLREENTLSEVIPGVLHWSAPHPNHGQVVHSHYLTEQRAAIDPIGEDGLADALEAAGGVEQVLLTNRHHERATAELAERFGAAIRVPRTGLQEFRGPDSPEVIAYDWGDEVMEGVVAHEVGSLAPDDGALHIAIGPGALALADSVVRDESGLGFVPDSLMDDPERTKEGLLASLRRLLDLEWDVLLMAHGGPLPAGGKQALAGFVENPRTAGL
jgi:glyoxylase-like metal-dependent hydrolase (beta-lactamase superfamily II)